MICPGKNIRRTDWCEGEREEGGTQKTMPAMKNEYDSLGHAEKQKLQNPGLEISLR